MRKGLLGCVLVVCGCALAATTAVTSAQTTDPSAQPTGLPDLAMHKILDVKIYPFYTRAGKAVKRRWAVRFSSIVDNLGPGHFILHAHRAKVGKPCAPGNRPTNHCERGDMIADQLVLNPDGTTTTYKNVGRAFFDPYHFHWHLRGASRYELRTANNGRRLARDRKSGFCFGDRLSYNNPKPIEYPPLSDGMATCLLGSVTDDAQDGRRALELTEGISAGYSDDYSSIHNGRPLEGQQLEVTKLKAGSYLLVNRTNATGKFRELTKANDASSVLFRLSWPHGRKRQPALKVLANCPGKATCTKAKKKPPTKPVG